MTPRTSHRANFGRLPIMAMALLGLLAGCASADPEESVDTGEAQSELQSPRFCGGRLGSECGDGQVCVPMLSNGCPGPDNFGLCVPRPTHCPDVSDPVCGCDGQTYANLCEAAQSGVVMGRRGTCEPPPSEGCGGDDGLTCPGAGVCVEDPTCADEGAPGGAHRVYPQDDGTCAMQCECLDELACPRGEIFDADPAVCACVPDGEEEDPCARISCRDGEQCVVAPDGSATCEPVPLTLQAR